MHFLKLVSAVMMAQMPASPPADWPGMIVNTGIVGVFTMLILTGWLWTKGAYMEMKTQRDMAIHLAELERARADKATERADRADATIREFKAQGELSHKVLEAVERLAKVAEQ